MTNTQITEALLGEAVSMAADVHWNQVDKGGVSYILHPLAVMRMVAPDRDLMVIAILHDALEDEQDPVKRMKIEHTLKARYPDYILEALLCMTHKPRGEETYEEYIERVAANYLARKVKIADLTHNLDPRRLPMAAINDRDYTRWEKYRKALVRLEREP